MRDDRRPAYRMVIPNQGRRSTVIMAALRLQDPLEISSVLSGLGAHVKDSPKPHKPTGIAKARRAAQKRKNCARS